MYSGKINYIVKSIDTTDLRFRPRAMINGFPVSTFLDRLKKLFEGYYDQEVKDVEVDKWGDGTPALSCKVTLDDDQVMDHFVLVPGTQY